MDMRLLLGVIVAVTMLALGGIAGWFIGRGMPAQVKTREGLTNAVNSTGLAIGLTLEGDDTVSGYSIAGAQWRWADIQGPWNDAMPTCVAPLTRGQRVRLGLAQIAPAGDAPGGTKVIWLECLDRNTIPVGSP